MSIRPSLLLGLTLAMAFVPLAAEAQIAGETITRVPGFPDGVIGSNPTNAVALWRELYFSGCTAANGCEPWKFDTEASGAVPLGDIRSGAGNSSPSQFTRVGFDVYFTADDGSGVGIWKASASSTTRIVAGASNTTISGLAAFGNRLAYVSRTETGPLNASVSLNLTDGTSTTQVYGAGGICLCSISEVTAVERPLGGSGAPERSLYWNYIGNKSQYFMRFVDGAASAEIIGTYGGYPGDTKTVGSSIYQGDYNALKLWEGKTLKFEFPGTARFLTPVGGRVFFSSTVTGGAEPAVADGSGAVQIMDIYPGSTTSSPSDFAALGGGAAFAALSPDFGRELWITDGTAAGTRVIDINPGASGSNPTGLVNVSGRVYFAADDGTSGRELWRTDGTVAGTTRVRDLNAGSAPSNPTNLVSLLGKLYFAADDGSSGVVLWVASATVKVSVGDVEVTEGSSGATTANATVTLSQASTDTVTVAYATVDGSAVAGSDYLAASGTVTFAPGETSKAVALAVNGDTAVESTESFGVVLTGPVNALLARDRGSVRIVTDDGTPTRKQAVWQPFFAVDVLETPYVGDFNGDGKTDIITFTRQNPNAVGDVYASLSNGATFGANTKWHDFFAITTDETVIIGDYDGDGKDDIATWLGKGSKEVYVALSQGTGMKSASVWIPSIGIQASDVILSGDANGDGRADLIDFARTEGKVYVALSNGHGFDATTIWHNFFAVSTYERPRVGDLNGDGKVDIATFATDSPTAFGDVYVALSTGSRFGETEVSTKWHDFFAIRPSEEIRIGDIDGDGRDDFFTFLPPPFAQAYTARSRGTDMGPSVLWPEAVGESASDRIYVGDVNGDGKADIIIFAQGEGRVYVSLTP